MQFSNIGTIAHAYSTENKVTLRLKSINFNKSVKDKIFINITEYSNVGDPKEYRIPTYPKHWLTKELHKIKDITLWQSKLKPLETKRIIISLVDHDYPPLDSNEPLGSVKLIITNEPEGVNINWEDANFDEPIKIEKIIDFDLPGHIGFKLTNEQNEYIVNFFTKVY